MSGRETPLTQPTPLGATGFARLLPLFPPSAAMDSPMSPVFTTSLSDTQPSASTQISYVR